MFGKTLIAADDALDALEASVVLDARAGPGAREQFRLGHAPRARFVDLESDLSEVGDPRDGGRHPLPSWPTWLERVGAWGIAPATPVLIYDADDGGMAAARAWWMLRAIGHAPLAVVEGGWEALRRAGVRIEAGDVDRGRHGPPYPSERSEWDVVNAAEVEQRRSDPSWALVDARAPERYAGRSEPIDPVAGHIPGAVNVYWRSNVGADGKLAPRDEIRRRFTEALRGRRADRVVCYCGSGVTACHLLLAMEASGLSGAKLYVGSWSEWCRMRPDAISAT